MQFEGVNQAIVKLAQSINRRAEGGDAFPFKDMEPREIVNASWDADAGS